MTDKPQFYFTAAVKASLLTLAIWLPASFLIGHLIFRRDVGTGYWVMWQVFNFIGSAITSATFYGVFKKRV